MLYIILDSSDMSGASNTLAREFLTDVHQLCSAVAQRAEARDEDEEESHMVALGEYLVRGRGFLLLSTLDSIIDQVRKNEMHQFVDGRQILPNMCVHSLTNFRVPEFSLVSLSVLPVHISLTNVKLDVFPYFISLFPIPGTIQCDLNTFKEMEFTQPRKNVLFDRHKIMPKLYQSY